jgi:phospholipid/cholesterol/gamma-HCH transport system substrate-binding protein
VEDKVNYTLVGGFVLVLGAALVAGVLWLAAGLTTRKHYEPYQAIVQESVAGLKLDAPVKYLGVDVGKVGGIGIDPQNPRQVLLRFLIEQGTPVKQDAEAVLKTQGLTGIVYVELNGGSVGAPPLVATVEGQVPTIRTKPSLSARLENVLTNVLASVDRMSNNLNSVFDADNRAALKGVLADTAALAHALALQQRTITAGIHDAAGTASNAASASERIGPALDRVAAGAAAVEKLAVSAGHTADAAASGVQQIRAGTLPEIDRLLTELNQLALSMRGLSEQTRQAPSSLLLGGPTRPPGPGEEAPP